MCRASTSLLYLSKKDVDGRDKPGHDGLDYFCFAPGSVPIISSSFRGAAKRRTRNLDLVQLISRFRVCVSRRIPE